MKGISVIVCCYNSGLKLIPTLSHLAKQKTSSGLPYELIIVDNNCTDETTKIAYDTWSHAGEPFCLRIVHEKAPGLSKARSKGLQTASYEYIILCDDDNWLCEAYLSKVYHLFETLPDVALVGGVGEPVLESPAPAWFTELQGFGYAIGAEGRQTGYVDAIYGAGMAIRKSVILAVMNGDISFILSDRKGKLLSSGGDTEICILIKNAGYKIYFDESLSFKHFLNRERLQWKYYLKLRRSFGKANAHLHIYNSGIEKHLKRASRVKQAVLLAKFLISNWKYALFPSLFKNARCANFVEQNGMRTANILQRKK